MAGRRPKPTAMKELAGNPGRRKLNKLEPKPAPADPYACPSDLGPDGKKEWARMAPLLLEMGVLSKIDTSALTLYCAAYQDWSDAQRNIRKFGLVIVTKGKWPVQSPFLKISNAAADQMRRLLVEFGCTPSSRSRVSAAPVIVKDDADEWSSFAVQ